MALKRLLLALSCILLVSPVLAQDTLFVNVPLPTTLADANCTTVEGSSVFVTEVLIGYTYQGIWTSIPIEYVEPDPITLVWPDTLYHIPVVLAGFGTHIIKVRTFAPGYDLSCWSDPVFYDNIDVGLEDGVAPSQTVILIDGN